MTLICGYLSDVVIQNELSKAQAEPGSWQVFLVNNKADRRTNEQNKLFRMLTRKFAQQQGYSVAYWEAFLIERFLGMDDVTTEDGYVRKVPCATSGLSVLEFHQFLTACLAFAAEHQVVLGR